MAENIYDRLRKTADTLLSDQKFGGPFILKRTTGKTFDPATKKNMTTFDTYEGNCVKTTYKDDGLGKLADIIEAGDLTFLCTMNDITIKPEKNSDKIIFAGETYNIIEVEEIDPSGSKVVMHKCYARKNS